MKYKISLIQPLAMCFILFTMAGCSSLPNKQHAIVDGYSMEYSLMGEGNPTVLLESGFGADMANWKDVFTEISKTSRVFAYNRRGYGQSVPTEEANYDSDLVSAAKFVGGIALDSVAPGVTTAVEVVSVADVEVVSVANNVVSEKAKKPITIRSAATIIEEQRKLLKAVGLQPPYILVGHSLGGLYSLYFAKMYPEEVQGLILVDSSHPNQLKTCKEMEGKDNCGLPKMLQSILPDNIVAEFKGMELSGEQVSMAPTLTDIPLVVLSRGDKSVGGLKYIDKMWPIFQKDLSTLSSNSSQIIVKDSGHFIQSDQPQVVIDTVKGMVEAIEKTSIQ